MGGFCGRAGLCVGGEGGDRVLCVCGGGRMLSWIVRECLCFGGVQLMRVLKGAGGVQVVRVLKGGDMYGGGDSKERVFVD